MRPLGAAPDMVEQVGKSGGRHADAVVLDRQRVEPGSISFDDYLLCIGIVGVRYEFSYRRPWLTVDAISYTGENAVVCPEDGVDGGIDSAAANADSELGVRLGPRLVQRTHRLTQLSAWGKIIRHQRCLLALQWVSGGWHTRNQALAGTRRIVVTWLGRRPRRSPTGRSCVP